ncbi:uncharacterized protein LOC142618302 [Castanea sativa]|uniref:uncharacterized protein LOC142618302 n=1 Tax=Castanea sativa TaxID=21020 RepID=UPI003F64D7B5
MVDHWVKFVDHWELEFRRKGFSMALVLSRSLTTASLASLPLSSSFLLRNSNRNRVLNLTTTFVPQNGLRKRFSSSGLKWKYERRNHRFALRCEAAAVAEKGATDTSGEKFEYQAETIKMLESAIVASPLGLSPKMDGEQLIAVIPPLTKEHIHVVTNSCEDARQSIRRARQKQWIRQRNYIHMPRRML